MRNRTRMIAAAAAVTAALAAGSGAAVASTTGAKPGAPAKTVSASEKPGGSEAVGSSPLRSGRATTRSRRRWPRSCTSVRPGSARRSSRCSRRAGPTRRRRYSRRPPVRLVSAPSSCPPRSRTASRAWPQARTPSSARAAPRPSVPSPAEERQGHDAITAAVAQELHVSTARVNAALQPLFAAGRADTSSPVFVGGRPFAWCQHPAAVRRARARQAEPGRRQLTQS